MTRQQSQALKGFAVLLMLWHHLFAPERLAGYEISFFPLSVNQAMSIAVYCKICVSLFAFISGYGLYLSWTDKKTSSNQWVLNRYVRTFHGFWFVVVIAWIICWPAKSISLYCDYSFYTSWLYGFWNMLMELLGLTNIVQPNSSCTIMGTWWYMGASLFFILTAPLLFRLFSKAGVFSAGCIIFLLPRIVGGYPGYNHFFSFFPAFYFGAVFAKQDLFQTINHTLFPSSNSIFRSGFWRLVVYFVLVFISYKVFFSLPREIYWDILFGVLPIPVVFFFNELLEQISFMKPIFLFLGKHSMNIYLIHNFIRAVFLQNFIYRRGHCFVGFFILLGSSILLSMIVDYLKRVSKYNVLINRLIKESA